MDLGTDQSHVKLHGTPAPHQQENHAPEVIGTWSLRNREQLRKRKVAAEEKQTSQWLFGYGISARGSRRGSQNSGIEEKPSAWLAMYNRVLRQVTVEVEQGDTVNDKQATYIIHLQAAQTGVMPGWIYCALSESLQTKQGVPTQSHSQLDHERRSFLVSKAKKARRDISSPEQKKSKRQKTGKGNERRCRKRQQTAVLKVDPEPQIEKEMTEKALVPTERETEPPGSVTKALPPGTSQEKAVAEEYFSETCQYQETGAQNHPSETHQDIAEPEDFSPEMCQEIAVLQDHPSKMHPDMAEPEDLSPKMCQGTFVVTALPSKTSEDTAGLEGCSPEVYPKPDVPKGYPLETDQKTTEPKEWNSEPDQGTAENKSFFPKIQDTAVPEDLSTKTYQETTEPEYSSHKTYKEVTVPKAPSPKTVQETPGPEEYSPKIYEETSGPEDLSTKTCANKNVPKECFPEPHQETGGPEGQDPMAHQEDAKDFYTSPREIKEKPKAEEPGTPSNLNSPQEDHPENDIYSYVLF
uniref:Hemogen n=1 Tax=Loxodonta africana TaxID=9785 RepID=G3T3M0_LOXAF